MTSPKYFMTSEFASEQCKCFSSQSQSLQFQSRNRTSVCNSMGLKCRYSEARILPQNHRVRARLRCCHSKIISTQLHPSFLPLAFEMFSLVKYFFKLGNFHQCYVMGKNEIFGTKGPKLKLCSDHFLAV